eukprot:1180884-Prorocentrum_minimum.AAC.3
MNKYKRGENPPRGRRRSVGLAGTPAGPLCWPGGRRAGGSDCARSARPAGAPRGPPWRTAPCSRLRGLNKKQKYKTCISGTNRKSVSTYEPK